MTELPSRVHVIGIGGSHMSAITRLLLTRGVKVSGSDRRRSEVTDELSTLGAQISIGHSAQAIGGAELVVYTAAVGDSNPELQAARERGVPTLIRAEMVARLMEGKSVLAVSGTHGKTTTSTMIALILTRAGHSPMYLLGADSLDLGPNAAWGEGPLCVVEADEYRSAFLEYEPDLAVLTNIDPDHLEYFRTPEAYRMEFERFVGRIRRGGTLLACLDDPGSSAVLDGAPSHLLRESYGLDGRADWRAENVRFESGAVSYLLRHRGNFLGEIRVGPPGRHTVQNSLAAAATALHQGVSFSIVASALGGYLGARRRFERIGEAGGIEAVDDYSHHPTEVRAFLETARLHFPDKRLVVVYQPLTYTRIKYLWEDWLHLWEPADELIVLETFGSREDPQRPGAEDLAAAISSPRARYAADVETAARLAVEVLREGDVLLTVGADEVAEVGPRVLERLQ
ncbi:MAG: UDP-N-acetylmuramate--L-alanine ligase [Dehalococcoidia bacterium]